jgi:iron complex outermembrane receptor protein
MELTLGMRYDHYSDFGSTTNPRAAFVWNVSPPIYLKFLYGRAFLAPSFHEYYLKNTPLIVGSQDLDPATMETFEIRAIYTISDYMTGSITYFYNNEDDVIIPTIQTDPNTPNTYMNSKGDRIQGIELEWNVDFKNQLYGYMNYTYRETEARETHDDVPFASKHLAKFGINLPIAHYFTANVQASVIGEKSREAGDPREPLESYWVVDATLIAKNFYKGWEVMASVHNLFDEEYDDPSLAGSFPGDYPKPGREVWFGIRYNFTITP